MRYMLQQDKITYRWEIWDLFDGEVVKVYDDEEQEEASDYCDYLNEDYI